MSHIYDKAKENNGSFIRTEASVAACSVWYIPGGIDYHLARSVVVFFDRVEDATNFHNYFNMPPEMSDLYPLTEKVWNDHFSMAKYDEHGIFTQNNHC